MKIDLSYNQIISLLDSYIEEQTDEIKECVYYDLINKYMRKHNKLISKKVYKDK